MVHRAGSATSTPFSKFSPRIFAFFLTRCWVLRGTVGERHGHFHGIWQGAVAALLIWFSPDLIINAHAWPQWDTWIVPWYLCGCLLASLDWWFAAGVAIAIGAQFQGPDVFHHADLHHLAARPGPRRPGTSLDMRRCLRFAVITSGWLITYLPPDRLAAARSIQANLAVTDYPPNLLPSRATFDLPAAVWISEMLLVAATVPWLLRVLVPDPLTTPASRWRVVLHSRWTWIAAGTLLIVAAVWWPWLIPKNRSSWYVGLLAARYRGRRGSSCCAVAARATSSPLSSAEGLLACIGLFHGSTACGGTAPFITEASIGHTWSTGPASNVPAFFNFVSDGKTVDQIAFTLPAIHGHWPALSPADPSGPTFDFDVTAKMLFFDTIYDVLLMSAESQSASGPPQRPAHFRRVRYAVDHVLFLSPCRFRERYLFTRPALPPAASATAWEPLCWDSCSPPSA